MQQQSAQSTLMGMWGTTRTCPTALCPAQHAHAGGALWSASRLPLPCCAPPSTGAQLVLIPQLVPSTGALMVCSTGAAPSTGALNNWCAQTGALNWCPRLGCRHGAVERQLPLLDFSRHQGHGILPSYSDEEEGDAPLPGARPALPRGLWPRISCASALARVQPHVPRARGTWASREGAETRSGRRGWGRAGGGQRPLCRPPPPPPPA